MNRRPGTRHVHVRVEPVEVGYALFIDGSAPVEVADGYAGRLDEVARDLVAAERGLAPEAVAVHLHFGMMRKYRRPVTPNWRSAALGLVLLAVAAAGLGLRSVFWAFLAALGVVVLIAYQVLRRPDRATPRDTAAGDG